MNEQDIIRIIESHIEKIFMEIWKPIENKIRGQIHDTDSTLNTVDKSLAAYEKKYTKLRQEFRSLRHVNDVHREENIAWATDLKNNCSTLKKDILYEVKDSVKLAIVLGKKAQELQVPLNDKIADFNKDVDRIQNEAKFNIKNEADLRIIEILNLKKKFEELVKLSDRTLRKHELFRNVEEPSKIIL